MMEARSGDGCDDDDDGDDDDDDDDDEARPIAAAATHRKHPPRVNLIFQGLSLRCHTHTQARALSLVGSRERALCPFEVRGSSLSRAPT